MKYRTSILSALAAFVALGGTQTWAQQAANGSIFSVAVTTGVAAVAQRTGIPGNDPALLVPDNLAGMTYDAGNFGLTTGPAANAFYSLTGRVLAGAANLPQTTPQAADFMSYDASTGPTTVQTYSAQQVPDRFYGGSYSGLVYAPSNYTFSTALEAYTIHHGTAGDPAQTPTDYWTAIIPSTGTGTLVTDYKPMSWPAGSGGAGASNTTPGLTGYFALTEADDISAAGPYAPLAFYYLRTDTNFSPSHTQFGQFVPALGTSSADKLDLSTAVGSFGGTAAAIGGYTYKTLAYYQGAVAAYPTNQFYYLRTDSTGTGNTILGRLNPDKITAGVRTISDIANLGSTFNTLTYVTTATFSGADSDRFYTTGLKTQSTGAQSVSFAAIADQNSGVSFTVTPSAAPFDGSAGGTITLTVVGSSTGSATVSPASGPSGSTFTVLPTAPGIVTLQATQLGGGGYDANHLQQSFNVLGPVTTQAIATKALTAGSLSVSFTPVTVALGTDNSPIATVVVTPVAPGGPAFANGLSINLAGLITGIPSGTLVATDYTVTATDSNGVSSNKTFNLTVNAAPTSTLAIATKVLTAGTPAAAFAPVTVQNGTSPFSFGVSPALPATLVLNTGTGAITGTPSAAAAAATYTVTVTDAAGVTTSKSFSLTINAVLASTQAIASTTVTAGMAVAFTPVTAVNGTTPYAFAVVPALPGGLSMNTSTGAITGTPGAAAVAATYTVTVTDAATATTSKTFSLTVNAGAAPDIFPPVVTSASITGTVGAPLAYQIIASHSPTSYGASGLLAGLAVNSVTGMITGTPTTPGSSGVTLRATNKDGTGSASATLVIVSVVSTQPVKTTAVSGGSATFSVGVTGGSAATYQWLKDGVVMPGATGATLVIGNVQSANVGFYSVVVSNGGTTTTTTPAPLAMTFPGQTAGSGIMAGTAIHHQNGNIYDQVLMTGTSVSVKANPGQVVRTSYVDLTNDIVQVEFSGAGIVTISLDNSSGPAVPVNYNQPDVAYMKGHASIAITGADATTNVTVFSVGRSNAWNQALFRTGTTYDGWADIGLLTVSSVDGHLGGIRTANASYFGINGTIGIYAPGVQLSGPVFAGDIDAANSANAVLVLGSVADAEITGGDLFQDNGGGVEVSGMTRLQFTAGTSSGGAVLPAQTNRGRLMTNGVNVTSQLVP